MRRWRWRCSSLANERLQYSHDSDFRWAAEDFLRGRGVAFSSSMVRRYDRYIYKSLNGELMKRTFTAIEGSGEKILWGLTAKAARAGGVTWTHLYRRLLLLPLPLLLLPFHFSLLFSTPQSSGQAAFLLQWLYGYWHGAILFGRAPRSFYLLHSPPLMRRFALNSRCHKEESPHLSGGIE